MAESTKAAPRYVAVRGFDHDPSGTRVDEGKLVPDTLPEDVVKALLKQGTIKKKAGR